MDEILKQFTEQQRRTYQDVTWEREEFPTHTRLLSHEFKEGFICYSHLDESNADAVIQGEVEFFKHLGYPFEWKYYDYDTPVDLKDRLEAHGFVPEEVEALLMLDLNHIPARLLQPAKADIRRITDPEMIATDVMGLQAEVWEEDMSDMVEFIKAELIASPDHLSIYVAYVDDKPVCSAWLRLPQSGDFGSLWAGSTLPEYRKRGIYSDISGVRVREAKERGLKYLFIDASDMSRPILEKQGFQFYAYTYPCKWKPS